MTESRPRLTPGPDHPITIEPAGRTVTVRRGGTELARSTHVVELREADYPPVYYIPLEDVDRSRLAGSRRHTYCPYKGEASYYDVADGSGDPDLAGSVWYYPEPYEAVSPIAGRVAFYADRFDINVE
jgi:uncharacterized protein (DUF427 family)